jgi:hypothetical protein
MAVLAVLINSNGVTLFLETILCICAYTYLIF